MSAGKRFLFVMWDGGGTVPPELAVARRLVGRGHSVRVPADPTIEQEACAVGCDFSPWTTAPHRTSRDRSHDILKDYEHTNPMKMMDAYLREFLAGPAPRWAADTAATLDAHPADVLVVDFALPAALIPGERLKVPAATLMPNIWVIPTPGIPPLGPGLMPARGWPGRLRDAILRAMTRGPGPNLRRPGSVEFASSGCRCAETRRRPRRWKRRSPGGRSPRPARRQRASASRRVPGVERRGRRDRA